MGPSKLSKRPSGTVTGDWVKMANSLTGEILVTIPETTAGHISAPVPFSCLKWRMRTTGYFVLFDIIQSEAVVTCHKHGISTLVP